ncbi:GNAT family N-acetyltransferase, partial [Streptomyces atratus]|uniref:GNAT family N-acetyltransferase n=1 Tax=Streptomyces atratus TaxID=1893 RepID=UPI003699062F
MAGCQDGIRQPTAQDEEVFAAFQASASEQDMDDAYVELAHRAVSGAFEDERLVRAASMYPWDDSTVADLGVLTLPSFRGQGHARRVVRAICRHAAGQGHEPSTGAFQPVGLPGAGGRSPDPPVSTGTASHGLRLQLTPRLRWPR